MVVQIADLTLSLDSTTTAVVAGVALAVMAVSWFALRFWIISTRPPKIHDIPMPGVDQLNQRALEAMCNGQEQEDSEEDLHLAIREAAQSSHPIPQ